MSTQPLPKSMQKAHRYNLATLDMEEVIIYLDAYDQLELAQRDNTSEWFYACQGLLCAAIVAYCRPFSENRSKGFADERLQARILQSVKERRPLHNLLVEKRNTIIAHADWKARSTQILQVEQRMVSWRSSRPNVWEGIDLKEFRRLAEGVFRECMDEGLNLAQAAKQEAGRIQQGA